MTTGSQTAAVIPCLDEASTIRALVLSALRYVATVIVVDDGSRDGTAEIAATAGAVVLRNCSPTGKGAALKQGFTLARARGFTWALALDGDGQHAPEDIPAFLQRAAATRARMIVGNRMGDPSGMPFVRRRVNAWMSAVLSRYCGATWPDTQCGFRLIHLDSWAQLTFQAHHFEIESELLVRFAAAGHPVDFVPVQTRYAGERSKIHPLRDTFRWFKWWRETKGEFGRHTRNPLEMTAASAQVKFVE